MPLRRVSSSALDKGGTRDGGRETGVEKPTTDDAGSKGLEAQAAPVSRDANDLLRTGGVPVDAGTGGSIGAGADADVVDRNSLVMSCSAHNATISPCVVPSRGRVNASAERTSCNTTNTVPDGDASVKCGLV